ncbi:MAG: hypothetical protein RL458_184, partial [Pseudomonadota bacterium]
ALKTSPNYPGNSSSVREIALQPVDAAGNNGFFVNPGGDNYGARVSGYLAPAESGAVNLYLTGDDSAELWLDLSADGTGPLTRVASLDSAVGTGDWTRNASQKSASITLERGRLYRFEILMKEGSGGDFVRVGYSKAGSSTVQVLPANWVLPDLPTQLSVTLTAPAGGVVVLGGSDAVPGQANSPSSDGPLNVLDGDAGSKYFNRDKLNTGLVFAYPQAYAADTLRLVTAGDAPERDPMQFVLYGSNESADWSDDSWVEVASGDTGLSAARRSANDIAIDNDTAYRFYKVVFPTLRDAARASGMQIADVTLSGSGVSLAAVPFGSVSAKSANGITISGDAVSRTLSGNVHALHRYLNTVGNVEFTGMGTQLQVRVSGTQALSTSTVVPSLASGSVTLEVWNNLNGTALTALTGSALYPNRSTSISEVAVKADTGFIVNPGGDNYGARVSGYFAPTESGSFNLYLTADDSAELWVDVSGTEQGSLTRVAQVTSFVNAGEWTKTPVQRSAALTFEKGKLYRFEALLKEATGGDYIRVGYAKAGTTTIAPIPSNWLIADTPSQITVTLSAPAGGVVVAGGSNASGSKANSPANEVAANAADGNTGTKYLNTDGPGSGLVFSAPQPVSVDAIQLSTRTNDDIWQWDPKRWQLWGSNASGDWNAQGWSLIDEGETGLANDRGASSTVAVENAGAFRFYKLVFTETKGTSADGRRFVHVSEARLLSAGQPIEQVPYGEVVLAPSANITIGGSGAVRTLTGSIHAVHAYLGTSGNVQARTNGQSLEMRVSAALPEPRTAPIGSAPLAGDPIAAGSFRVERWADVGGTRVSDLTGNARYAGAPSTVERVSGKLEITPNRDAYGERLSGWISPPESGSYRLWVAADDTAELWVDTSGTGTGALTRVAFIEGAVTAGAWTKNASQKSAAITLEKGRLYRFEVLHKEGSGGDFVQVGVSKANEAAPQVMPANWLAAGSEQLMLTFSAAGTAGGAIIAKAGNGITIGGTDTARTVTGTWAALSAWMGQADAVRYSGSANTLTMVSTSLASNRVLESRSIFVGAGKLAVNRASSYPLGAGRLDVDKAYTIEFARPSIDLNLASTLTLGDSYSASAVVAGNRLLVADLASRETYFYNRNDQGTRETPGQLRVLEAGAADWSSVTGAANANWSAIATDASGTKLIVASAASANGAIGSLIYTGTVSANGAITLTESMRGVPAGESWVSVDSDASGRFLVAAAGRSAAVLKQIADLRAEIAPVQSEHDALKARWDSYNIFQKAANAGEGIRLAALGAQLSGLNGNLGRLLAIGGKLYVADTQQPDWQWRELGDL